MTNAVTRFDGDDEGYRNWYYAHPTGFVVNALRGHPTGGEPILHTAMCDYIAPQAGSHWTSGEYLKICSEKRIDVDLWTRATYGVFPRPCPLCQP